MKACRWVLLQYLNDDHSDPEDGIEDHSDIYDRGGETASFRDADFAGVK